MKIQEGGDLYKTPNLAHLGTEIKTSIAWVLIPSSLHILCYFWVLDAVLDVRTQCKWHSQISAFMAFVI
jgi:hypothetical protein